MTDVSVAQKQRRANGQGSIYWDAKRKRWVASAFDIHRKRHSKFYKRKLDAENWLHDQRIARQLGNSTYALDEKATVAQFLLAWVEQYRGNIRPNTYRNYRETITSRINPYIGDLNAAKLSPISIERLYGELQERGYRAGSIKIVHRVLSAAYNHAVRMESMPRNPLKKVRIPKLQSTPTRNIPFHDYQTILSNAAWDPEMNARVIVGICIGPRTGEILGLKWSDIDWLNKTLTIERQVQRVKGKGLDFYPVKQGSSRRVPLADNWISALREHQEMQERLKSTWEVDRGLIFPNAQGDFLDAKLDWKRWKRFLQQAGIQHYEPRQMRKTAFSLFAHQTDFKTVMEFTGHSQVSTVMNSYVFALPESLTGAVKAIENLHPHSNEMNDEYDFHENQEEAV